jgi:hypothetical protein
MMLEAFGVEDPGDILDAMFPNYDAERDMNPEPVVAPGDKAAMTEAVHRASLMVKLLEKK